MAFDDATPDAFCARTGAPNKSRKVSEGVDALPPPRADTLSLPRSFVGFPRPFLFLSKGGGISSSSSELMRPG